MCFLCTTTQGPAQNKITTTQLLSHKPGEANNTLFKNNIQFLKETKQEMPVVNKMELRTETDELDISRQEYLVRLSLNSRKTRKVQDEINKNNARFYELKAQIAEEANLVNRYELAVDWYYTQSEFNYLKEKKILKEDEKAVLQKMLINSTELDIKDLLKVDEEIQRLDRDILQINFEKDHIIQQLLPAPELSVNFELDSSRWISLETMAFVLNQIQEVPTHNLALALQETKTDFEQLEFNMEKAKSKQLVDFVQLKYTERDDLAFQKELSFGIGFKFPLKSDSRIKLNEARLNIYDEQYKQESLQTKFEKNISDQYATFNALEKEYQLLEQQILENNLAETLKKYSANGTVHPLTLLRITESLMENTRNLQKLEKDACFLFLEILEDKGLLSQTPAINYLSDDLKPL